jgi:hypothetical protein
MPIGTPLSVWHADQKVGADQKVAGVGVACQATPTDKKVVVAIPGMSDRSNSILPLTYYNTNG